MRAKQDRDQTLIPTNGLNHTADFICDHAQELAGLAESSGLQTLGCILRMAEQEAQNIIAASHPFFLFRWAALPAIGLRFSRLQA